MSDIDALQSKLERYEKKLQDSNAENRSLFKQAYEEFEVKRTENEKRWEIKYDKLRKDYELKLSMEKKKRNSLSLLHRIALLLVR